ncbi:IucA/IucC family protein [Streptomyces paludis]|uniref:IucA/IucC family protein n=1 Tax=Streptomyces paludis TaxID=2282738 RepID=UPI0013B3CC1D|nr:IucA/IucC family protein [Streptomyces paludis]
MNSPHSPNPLDEPDAARAGDTAATETLLRTYVRETGTAVPPTGQVLYLTLPMSRLTLRIRVRYHSPTGRHRFGRARVATSAYEHGGGGGGRGGSLPADTALVAAALVRESTTGRGLPPHRGADTVRRVLDSSGRTAAHIARRRAEEGGARTDGARTGSARTGSGRGLTPFLDSEQAMLLGDPFHPAPQSREGATERELDTYSPESRGYFALHWFAAHPEIVVGESADDRTPADLLRPLVANAGLDLPPGMVPLPAHPWQARELLGMPGAAALLDAGLLRPLGPAGPAWYPTSSVRTVHRPGADVMLKLSLGMRVAGSGRLNHRTELSRGVRLARLLSAACTGPAGPGEWLRAEHPEFGVLRDFAWVSVGPESPADSTASGPETGLETAFRDNPFNGSGRGPEGLSVAGLLAERPGPGDGTPPRHRALLSEAVARTVRAHGIGTAEASARWLGAYLDVLAVPLIRLRARYGVALAPYHRNTLVALDAHGLPRAGWYRDGRGYRLAASRAEGIERLLPGATADGAEVVQDDALVDEHLARALGIGNLLGLVGAFGALGLADEAALVGVVRGRLAELRSAEPGAEGLLDLLLDAPVLRCEAPYLTCVEGRPVQIAVPNLLAEGHR